MNKPISVFIITLCFLGTVGFGGYQYQQANTTRKAYETVRTEKANLESSLTDAHKTIDHLHDEKVALEERIAVLRDSIATQAQTIESLRQSLARRKKALAESEKALEELRTHYFKVDAALRKLKQSTQGKDNRIAQLEQELNTLRAQNDQKYTEQVQTQQALDMAEQDLVELEMQKIKQEQLLHIMENTDIYFDNFVIKKADNGPDQKKIKKNGRAWNYTYIDLTLQNDNIHLLLDETFVLKIVDIDNNQELSYIESNPAFPESTQDNKGLTFQFTGEPLRLIFHNNQEKTGENYAVQLYYVQDGKEYRLKNGYKQFIVQGKILS